MIHLLYSILIICGSFGLFLSKTDKSTIIRKNRQHFKPLSIDKDVIHS
jgi:hypothetical protein